MDWNALVNAAPSVVVALLFAWFVLELLKRREAFSRSIMDEWAKRLETRDKDWQRFIEEQQRMQSDAGTRLAEEVKGVATEVGKLQVLVEAHDRNTREWIEEHRKDKGK